MNESILSTVCQTPWWGTFQFELASTRCWQLASLQLWIQRLPTEWRITFHNAPGKTEHSETAAIIETDTWPENEMSTERFLCRQTKSKLQILPALAPRSVVVRPTSPLHLPAGEKATLFISTPVWLQIKTDSPAKTLRELGVIRPSDTWFGSNTREGELCYAARTPADLDFSAIQRQPHRAISKVEVDNKANSTLLIDRLSLPVVYLPLYAAQDNLLWTPDVSLQREEDGDFAALKIGTSAPSNAKTAKKITDPREVPDKGILVRAFQALFE